MTQARTSQAVQADPSAGAAPVQSTAAGGVTNLATGRQDRRAVRLPGEDLSLNEMLRVMDVARELRRNRVVAEEMFRRDEIRAELRGKLMRSAEIAGDPVTEAEIDVAIDQYLTNLHTYADPPRGLQSVVAHAWVRRYRIVAGAVALGAAVGMYWFMFT